MQTNDPQSPIKFFRKGKREKLLIGQSSISQTAHEELGKFLKSSSEDNENTPVERYLATPKKDRRKSIVSVDDIKVNPVDSTIPQKNVPASLSCGELYSQPVCFDAENEASVCKEIPIAKLELTYECQAPVQILQPKNEAPKQMKNIDKFLLGYKKFQTVS